MRKVDYVVNNVLTMMFSKKIPVISIETDKLKNCQLKNNPGYDFMFQVATFKKREPKRM